MSLTSALGLVTALAKPTPPTTHMQKQFLAVAVAVFSFTAQGAVPQNIAKLEDESIAESLAKLSDVNMFNLVGMHASEGRAFLTDTPLGKDAGKFDLDAIMSNRRFRKIFGELSRLDGTAAAEIINRELSRAVPDYLKMYEAEMLRQGPHFKVDKLAGINVFSGPVFAIGDVPEGEVVIAGARLKVLALVWTSGMLGLTGTTGQVERVARLAAKQRTDLYADSTLHPFFKNRMLERASLYNRQIISSGLLGVVGNRGLVASAIQAAGVEWQERKWVVSNDRSGARNLDDSLGSLTAKFTAPMDDAHFDILLKELHLSQQTGSPEK